MERVGDADTAVVQGEAQHEVVVRGLAHHRGGLRLPALVRVVLRAPQELPPVLQRGEVPGDVHTARVAATQPTPVPAAGALPRRRGAVLVEGGEDGDVRGVHQLRDQGILGQRWSLVRGPGSPTLLWR